MMQKRILAGWLAGYLSTLFLLCAGPALAQHSQSDYDTAYQKKQAAWDAYRVCTASASPCGAEYAVYSEASDAVLAMIHADMRANEPALDRAAAELNRVADRLNRYVLCSRLKHWWQFWKRCRF